MHTLHRYIYNLCNSYLNLNKTNGIEIYYHCRSIIIIIFFYIRERTMIYSELFFFSPSLSKAISRFIFLTITTWCSHKVCTIFFLCVFVIYAASLRGDDHHICAELYKNNNNTSPRRVLAWYTKKELRRTILNKTACVCCSCWCGARDRGGRNDKRKARGHFSNARWKIEGYSPLTCKTGYVVHIKVVTAPSIQRI